MPPYAPAGLRAFFKPVTRDEWLKSTEDSLPLLMTLWMILLCPPMTWWRVSHKLLPTCPWAPCPMHCPCLLLPGEALAEDSNQFWDDAEQAFAAPVE